MPVGPNMPAKKSGGKIMRQGQTAGQYGLDPDAPNPDKRTGEEPRELRP